MAKDADTDLVETNDEPSPVDVTEAESPPPPGSWRRPGRSVGLASAGVALVAIVSTTGWMYTQHRNFDAEAAQRAQYVQAARDGVTAMISIDFNHAQDDVKRVLDASTGKFKDDFGSRADSFAAVVEQAKVNTTGEVTAAGIESTDDHSATILVSAVSKVTNAAGAEQEPRIWRLRVVVDQVDGKALMSKVDFAI